MFQDVVSPPEQPPMEQVSSSLSAQLLELCESDLYQETPQNHEDASSSNHCSEGQSLYTKNPSILPYRPIGADSTTNNDFSLVFEDKITPLDLTNTSQFTNHQYPFSDQGQFDLSMLQNQINNPILSYPRPFSNDHDVPIDEPTTLLNFCEEAIISPMLPSKFMLPDNMECPNYPFIDPSMNSKLQMSTEDGNLFLGKDIQIHELEVHGDNNGIFSTNHLRHSFNSNDLQVFSNESQHLVHGGGSFATPFVSDITSLEPESLRVTSKLTSEERKEKINKYMKKRNKRNFNKKIKYACRKTLADSRPRVRGRFAKHDEFGDNNGTNSFHDEDTDDDERHVHDVVKEEEDSFESSDILAHISGVNSFKCNYPVESWI